MISFQTFLLGLLIASTMTGLVTEAIKKMLEERNKNYYSNTIAGISAIAVSAAISVAYVLLSNIAFTTPVIVYMIALIFMSWLCAMVGYDKVMQAISQFKTNGKDE